MIEIVELNLIRQARTMELEAQIFCKMAISDIKEFENIDTSELGKELLEQIIIHMMKTKNVVDRNFVFKQNVILLVNGDN